MIPVRAVITGPASRTRSTTCSRTRGGSARPERRRRTARTGSIMGLRTVRSRRCQQALYSPSTPPGCPPPCERGQRAAGGDETMRLGRLVPLRTGAVRRRIADALSVYAMLLLHLPQGGGRRRLRHQHHGRGRDLDGRGRGAPDRLPGTRRGRPAQRSAAPFLPPLRIPPVGRRSGAGPTASIRSPRPSTPRCRAPRSGSTSCSAPPPLGSRCPRDRRRPASTGIRSSPSRIGTGAGVFTGTERSPSRCGAVRPSSRYPPILTSATQR